MHARNALVWRAPDPKARRRFGIAASAGVLLLGAARPAGGELVLNEVLYDPAGPDGGHEFVEIYNCGTAPVSLAGVRLLFANGAGEPAWQTPAPSHVSSPVHGSPSPHGVPAVSGVNSQFSETQVSSVQSLESSQSVSPWQDARADSGRADRGCRLREDTSVSSVFS